MAYVSVPNDLTKIKSKLAFNLTKRQLICFGGAALIGIPTYLLIRSVIGCQRQYEIVRKRRRNFVVFRRGCG